MSSPLLPGLVSISFRERKPAAIITAAAAAGLKAIEWGGDVHVPHGNLVAAREVGVRSAGHGLAIAAYGSYYHAGWSSDHGLEFPTVLATALALGAPCIRVWAGRAGSHAMTADQRAGVVSDLRRCAGQAAAVGMRIATEFHADTLMDTAASACAVLQEVAHPALRTYWQPIHGEETELAVSGLRRLTPWLENIHVFHWWPTLAERHLLTTGADRWRAFLAAAALAPTAKCALLEFMPHGALSELPTEADALRSLLA